MRKGGEGTEIGRRNEQWEGQQTREGIVHRIQRSPTDHTQTNLSLLQVLQLEVQCPYIVEYLGRDVSAHLISQDLGGLVVGIQGSL